jgi:hypothetical protein
MTKPNQHSGPVAPDHFSAKALALWEAVNDEFKLEADAVATFRVALENLDLADKARELLRTEGLVVDGKKHPASDAVKLHDGLYLRALRALALDVVAPSQTMGRPPGGMAVAGKRR